MAWKFVLVSETLVSSTAEMVGVKERLDKVVATKLEILKTSSMRDRAGLATIAEIPGEDEDWVDIATIASSTT
jgi:hypothetical protein